MAYEHQFKKEIVMINLYVFDLLLHTRSSALLEVRGGGGGVGWGWGVMKSPYIGALERAVSTRSQQVSVSTTDSAWKRNKISGRIACRHAPVLKLSKWGQLLLS